MVRARVVVAGMLAWACTSVTACTGAPPAGPPSGPTLRWSADPSSLDNPFPDGRLVDEEGHPRVRDQYWVPFLPAAASTLEADALFGGYTTALSTLDGWSLSGAFMLRTSAPVDADSLRDGMARFVSMADGTVVEARLGWRADPGYLHVRALGVLAGGTEHALVLARGATAGGQPLVESADAWAFRRGDGRAELEEIAARARLNAADVLWAMRFRTQDATTEMLRAVETAHARSPVANISTVPVTSPRQRGVFTPDRFEDAFGTGHSLGSAGRVAVGTFQSMDMRGSQGSFDPAVVTGSTTGAMHEVEFILVEPDATRFPPPWPTVIAQHGFNGNNRFVLNVAGEFNDEGWAVIGIDAVDHGARGNVFNFFNVQDLPAVRDRFRQTVLDQLQLARLVMTGSPDVDGIPGADLDGTVAYFGHSFGAITGTVHTSVAPHRPVAVVNAAGGGLTAIMDSESLRGSIGLLVRPLLGLDASDPGYEDSLPLLQVVVQSIFDAADPLAYAAVLRARHATDGRPRYLLQEDVGDTLVPNAQTDLLAIALGAQTEIAARMASDGLVCRWRLDPVALGVTANVDPHDTYFQVPGARRQAARFIASDGTELLDVP